MKNGIINPLLLLIMTQAWCHVKRDLSYNKSDDSKLDTDDDTLSFDPSLYYQNEIIPLTMNDFNNDHSKVFSKDGLAQVWDHPFFKSSLNEEPLSIKQLVAFWGDGWDDSIPSKKSSSKKQIDKDVSLPLDDLYKNITSPSCTEDFWILSNEEDFNDCLNSFDKPPKAIKIFWREIWADQTPEWIYTIIDYKDKNRSQLWMDVLPNNDLWLSVNDKSVRKSIQLGWSWWLRPPNDIDKLQDYFCAFKKNYKFWFSSSLSDQWVWPWCDMLTKNILENVLLLPQQRYWLSDIKSKAAWLKLDEALACDLNYILGDSECIKELVSATFLELDKVDFLDRPFDK